MVRRRAVDERSSASFALAVHWLAGAESDSGSVLLMPFPASRRPVPLRRERSDRLKMLASFRGLAPLPPVIDVEGLMLGLGEANQVGDVVVERVTVLVMDVVTFRDRAMCRLPDVAVKRRAATTLAVLDPSDEVPTRREKVGVWVAAVEDAVEADLFDSGHDSILSEYRTASKRVQPRPSIQIG